MAVESESKSLRWSAHRSPNHTRQKGRKTAGTPDGRLKWGHNHHSPRAQPGARDLILGKPRRGEDNSPLAETKFDFLMSDVLVDCSTYAPHVYKHFHLPSIDDNDDTELHTLHNYALCRLEPR